MADPTTLPLQTEVVPGKIFFLFDGMDVEDL